MHKFLSRLLTIGCLIILNQTYAAMPGSPCKDIHGAICNSGTRGCVCAHHRHEVGKPCKDIHGSICHQGTQGCVCAKHQ